MYTVIYNECANACIRVCLLLYEKKIARVLWLLPRDCVSVSCKLIRWGILIVQGHSRSFGSISLSCLENFCLLHLRTNHFEINFNFIEKSNFPFGRVSLGEHRCGLKDDSELELSVCPGHTHGVTETKRS